MARLQVLGPPISRSTYSLIEMGRGNLFVNDLVELKSAFNVDYVDYEEFFKDISLIVTLSNLLFELPLCRYGRCVSD